MEHSLWSHLPLLVRSSSKDSVEYILQTLWRTRNTGIDAADRDIIRDMLNLQNDSDLDPLLVCLRMLIRRCVSENVSKDEIRKLFPNEVLPELQRLLTILLQKFQREWREDALKDQANLRRLMATELTDPAAVKYQLAKDTLETMFKSMHCMRDQLSNMGKTSNRQLSQDTDMLLFTNSPQLQWYGFSSKSVTSRFHSVCSLVNKLEHIN